MGFENLLVNILKLSQHFKPLNQKLQTKLKASSLFYAIVISLMIAMITGFLIVYSFHNQILFATYTESEKIQRNAASGLTLLMSKQTIIDADRKLSIDLYNNGTDSVQLERRSWGALEVLTSKAFSKIATSSKIALTGSKSKNETAIYLANNDRPLSVCGNTKIKGVCYIPNAEAKRAYIEGESFGGSQLIDGLVKKSDNTLPKFNEEVVKRILKRLSRDTQVNDSIIDLSKQELKDTIQNSFLNKTLLVYSPESIVLDNKYIKGNVILFSEKVITVNSSSRIEDAVLYAPGICIRENFNGSLQAFGSDSIQIQKNVTLNYPSFLGVIKPKSAITSGKLSMAENTQITGDVFTWQENTGNPSQSITITVEKNSTVNGNIYSNTYVDLKGAVYGSVTCQKFMLKTPSSVYENHLLNATIDITKLSKYFVGANLIQSENTKEVIKWLF